MLSLLGSCLSRFATSALLNGGKFDMSLIIRSFVTFADGFVAVDTSASIMCTLHELVTCHSLQVVSPWDPCPPFCLSPGGAFAVGVQLQTS
jgi:hypothetical protein